MSADLRFGSKADIRLKKRDVRFTPKSGHSLPAPPFAEKRPASSNPLLRDEIESASVGRKSITADQSDMFDS